MEMKIGIVSSSDIKKYNTMDPEFFLGGKVKCSLCEMRFYKKDKLIKERKEAHERFHSDCKMEKRNTTEGKVIWIDEN